MTFAHPDPRQASLEVVAAAALFLFVALPRRRRALARDDPLSAMQAVVLRVEEEGRTRTVRASLPITIGRAPTATLVIPDAQVSRLHARIDLFDGVLGVRDLDSRNGTLLNARPIDGLRALHDGDEIDVGLTRIMYCGVAPWK
ncbi:MAG: FHA domain-containing protein [Candidatus Eremiobacteraeota bacterium]|nr:FHA domain-containing protein [Candidatus Eremiobacteraeota bacterium]